MGKRPYVKKFFYLFLYKMIKKRSLTNGVNANVSLEPSAASQSTSNISNNIFINKREDGKEDVVITRDIELNDIAVNQEEKDVKSVILETYAQILLNQDKALLSNLIFKNCIIVPIDSLREIIKSIIPGVEVEIFLDEDIKCCASKVNPIRKVTAIKIINNEGEVVTDFKQVYNKEYNELVNTYHLCLKFAVYQ